MRSSFVVVLEKKVISERKIEINGYVGNMVKTRTVEGSSMIVYLFVVLRPSNSLSKNSLY